MNKKVIFGGGIILILLGFLIVMKNQSARIERIKIISIDWSIVTRNRLSCESLINISNNYQSIITERSFLNTFEKEISNLVKTVSFEHIDVRICLLIYRSGSKVDTLSFGPGKKCNYNGVSHKWHQPIFELVKEKIPLEHREIIEEIFNRK